MAFLFSSSVIPRVVAASIRYCNDPLSVCGLFFLFCFVFFMGNVFLRIKGAQPQPLSARLTSAAVVAT